MTIAAGKTPYHRYTPGSAMSAEAIPFEFLNPTDLNVCVVDGDPLVEGVDYELGGDWRTGAGTIRALIDGGTSEWELFSDTPDEQQLKLVESRKVPLPQYERELDRAAIRARENRRDLGRAAKVPHGRQPPVIDLEDVLEGDVLQFVDGAIKRVDRSRFAGKFYGGDASGRMVPLSGMGSDPALREDLASADAGAALVIDRFDAPGAVPLTQKQINDETVSVRRFGAVGNGSAGDSAAIRAAIDAVNSRGGGKVIIPRGTYLVDQSIAPLVTNDLAIEFQGARLVAAPGLNKPVLNIRGSATDQAAPNGNTLRIENPVIDCSQGDSSSIGTQQCTAIACNYFSKAEVNGGYLYGGEDPRNTNADSGFSPVTCGEVVVNGTTIRGFGDAGIYPGGNNDTTPAGDGGNVKLIGVTIQRCMFAVTAKRQMQLLQMIGGAVEECPGGVTSQFITAPNNLTPARRMFIIGVMFRKIHTNAVQAKGPTKLTVRDCQFEDWGYDFDQTNPAGTNAYAITFEGTSGADITGNSFSLNEWPLNGQRVYNFRNTTFDGVTYTHGDCVGSGNTYRNLSRVFVWSAVGGAHSFTNEYFENIADEIVNTTNLNPATEITYRQKGKRGVWHYQNGIRTQTIPQNITDGDGATLTSDDAKTIYNNDGAAALTVFTLPSAALTEPGDFSFIRMSGTYNVRVTAASGDVIRIPGSSSTAGGTVTSGARGDTITLRAIDSTNWVATSIGGTWAVA